MHTYSCTESLKWTYHQLRSCMHDIMYGQKVYNNKKYAADFYKCLQYNVVQMAMSVYQKNHS